ncbi:MAG: DUF1937 family protein [Candidatus Nealsonbacteria bacterium]
MKIVFIAGPYIGDGNKESIEKNIRNAEKYQIALANAGVGFFCPHNHTEHFQEKANAPEKFYRELDREILKRTCDGILVIPAWETSEGTRAEIEWAKKNNIPTFFPKSVDNLSEIINWSKKRD